VVDAAPFGGSAAGTMIAVKLHIWTRKTWGRVVKPTGLTGVKADEIARMGCRGRRGCRLRRWWRARLPRSGGRNVLGRLLFSVVPRAAVRPSDIARRRPRFAEDRKSSDGHLAEPGRSRCRGRLGRRTPWWIGNRARAGANRPQVSLDVL